MILIADSGSTKTDWLLKGEQTEILQTQGINPFHQPLAEIGQILNEELLPHLSVSSVAAVFFYGSGVRPEFEPQMENLLKAVFPCADTVEAHGDLLGAARSLFGDNYGIASILGTGANSCLYDGRRIVSNTPPLGYILGDEGSGAVLGRRFLNALYKGLLSKEMVEDFERSTSLTMAEVIHRVYRQPLANRFLASLSAYIHQHLDCPEIRQLVTGNFRDFFQKNIAAYGHPELPVSFVGSIAWYYQDELRQAASEEGFLMGSVVKSPLEGLLRYHQK